MTWRLSAFFKKDLRPSLDAYDNKINGSRRKHLKNFHVINQKKFILKIYQIIYKFVHV